MRIPILGAGLAVLLGATAFFLTDPFAWFGQRDDGISLDDPDRIDGIRIRQESDSVWLQRTAEGWSLGIDPGQPAEVRSVDNLLFAASNLEVQSVLSPDGEAALMSRRVDFYRNGKSVLGYALVFADRQCLLQRPGSAEWLLVRIPGFP
ncbi:MAG: hypothetical protein R2751_20110 [Bacteroidales bacterium]